MAKEKRNINTPEAKKIARDMKREFDVEPKKSDYAPISDQVIP